MSAWHMRLWRRMKVAPGVTVNLSKSGPSLSLGPRGAKMTFGRRGTRQTLGIPGTGIYATRMVGSSSGRSSADSARANETSTFAHSTAAGSTSTASASIGPASTAALAAGPPAAGSPAEAWAATPATSEAFELHFGMVTLIGIVLGLIAAGAGAPASSAITVAVVAIVGGLGYEALAHHHPTIAKVLVQVATGLVTLAATILGIILVGVVLGGLAAAVSGSGRRGR